MGKIMTVMSICEGNGSKYFSVNMAKQLLNVVNEEAKVLLIDFNVKNPVLGLGCLKEERKTMEKLIPLMRDKENQISHLLSNQIQETICEGIYLLSGFSAELFSKSMTSDDVNKILTQVVIDYDYVIVSVEKDLRSKATIETLAHTDEVFLVARQNHTNILNAPAAIRFIMQYVINIEKINIVYNYYTEHLNVDVNSNLLEYAEHIRVIGSLVYDEKSTDNMDFSKTQGFFNKNSNQKEILKICKMIYG